MRWLIACEFTGTVRRAFRERGFDAWSCDLLPAEDGSPFHIVGDALEVSRNGSWDGMVAHPPCTYLTLAGARWLYDDRYPTRRADMQAGIEFFNALRAAPIRFKALENPQPLGCVMDGIGRYDQRVQPWMFGDPETKGVCLWLDNLPHLTPTDIVAERRARVWRMPPGPDRQKERSRFFPGIAAAMAAQWGDYALASLREVA